MRIYYATHDGHTRKIARRIAEKIAEHGISADLHDLEQTSLPAKNEDANPKEPIVLVAALRYGFHLPSARRFILNYRKAGSTAPLVLLSVNLVARKPGKRSAQGNPYLRRWLRQSKVKPAFAEAIAGALDYPRYNTFDRWAIRLIMTITGGPTDPKNSYEFTDWDQVDGIAATLVNRF